MTPKERAGDIWSDVIDGAFLDMRMTNRQLAEWRQSGTEAIAAAIEAATAELLAELEKAHLAAALWRGAFESVTREEGA